MQRELGFHGADFGRVDAAHLAGAHADGLAVARVDDGVGFYVLANFPGEEQRAGFFGRGGAFGYDFEIGGLQRANVGVLHQHASGDIFQNPVARGGFGCRRTNASGATWVGDLHEAQIFLGREFCLGGFIESGRGDDFEKKFVHFFGGLGVDGAVHADHAAEGRHGVAFESALVSFGESFAGGGAAGVGVFDDGDYGLVEFLGEIPGGLQVDDVVEGQFLALELAGIGHAYARAVGVHGGLLMGIFAVTQVEGFVKCKTQRGWKRR